ncbi:LysR family transcriptional regulator [Burkholderia guangdongensis]|uniref:LysR family transcriptional regulator n=1 Tax=Burkholderia guangdongensis TaxID=1792500 RepID=UPI0015CBCF0C|nr:LysR family transcriptional regulator [Burkholderia guangdongensis]
MNFAQLQHLIALADTQSFSKAAQRAHVTQPALSRSIQALEEALGEKLVDRIGRRNELTPFGRTVVERARRIVFEATELMQSGSRLRQGAETTLRVGFGSGPGAMLTVPLMLHVAHHYPRAKLSIARGAIELQLQALRARNVDAIVVDVHSLGAAGDLAIERLPDLRAGFVARGQHPLAGRAGVTLDQMRRYPIVSTALSEMAARMMRERFGPDGDPQQLITLRCEEILSCLDVTQASDAIFLGIVAPARERIARGELAELQVSPVAAGHANLAIVTLAGRSEAPLMPMLRNFVFTHLHD